MLDVEGITDPLVDSTAVASEEVFTDEDVLKEEGDDVTSLFCP